jgi:hypothetical protein
VNTLALLPATTVGSNPPRAGSVVDTLSESPAGPAITSCPVTPLMAAVVPVLSVVPAAAASMAASRGSATVFAAPAVNTKVPPVPLSVMVVTEPAFSAAVANRGLAAEPCVDETEFVELLLNTEVPLKLVVEPIWLISFRIDVNSVFSAVDWATVSPPLPASVAIVTAWLRIVVTWESAPSAVCNRPMPLDAFWPDCVSAEMLAPRPSAIDSPPGHPLRS